MQIFRNNAANSAIINIYSLLLAVLIIACLYFGRAILIPLALAILLSFFLSLFVTRLEKQLGRVVSVLLVVIMVFIGISIISYVMTRQVVDLAAKLPDYKINIETKLRFIHLPQSAVFTRMAKTIQELKNEFSNPISATKTSDNSSNPIRVVEAKTGIISAAESFFGVFFSALGTAGFVLLLVFFMLLNREDLRGRIIRLIGQGRISSTTLAIDDASSRISHYLFMQLVVNLIFGVLVGIGLYFIGIPNPVLWSGLIIVLRFIPYLGVWIAASIPILLSLAVSTSWVIPIITVCLFLGLELIISNIVEPWLYGSRTGVSPMALIVAAVFWTWLWGPIGLVLSTSLTVCLVVMGHHVAKLEFLRILLSDEEPLTPDEECYHRLLANDQNDAVVLIETYLKTHTLTDLYDHVLIPALTAAETDLRLRLIDAEQGTVLRQNIREIIEDLEAPPMLSKDDIANPPVSAVKTPPIMKHAICLPARAERDELAGAMLSQLLRQQSFSSENISVTLTTEERITLIQKDIPDIIYISVVAPSANIHARYLCAKLRVSMPQMKIVVGMWGATEITPDAIDKLHSAGADEVIVSFAEAIVLLEKPSKGQS